MDGNLMTMIDHNAKGKYALALSENQIIVTVLEPAQLQQTDEYISGTYVFDEDGDMYLN